MCLTPLKDYELGIRCLGAVVWYLKACLLEFDLLSMKDFEIYSPVDSLEESFDKLDISSTQQNQPKYMVSFINVNS